MTKYITAREMARLHGASWRTLIAVLADEQSKPESERTIKGVTFTGEGKRKLWLIPLESAQSWQPRKRGRPVGSGKKAKEVEVTEA